MLSINKNTFLQRLVPKNLVIVSYRVTYGSWQQCKNSRMRVADADLFVSSGGECRCSLSYGILTLRLSALFINCLLRSTKEVKILL